MIAIVMLTMVVPPFVIDAPNVSGTVTKMGNGDLIVDGETYTIDMNGAYQHTGNITVKNSNGHLIIQDTVLNMITPKYQRNIYVQDNAKLTLINSTITVNLDTFKFFESLNIEVTNNGILDMTDSKIECDGWLRADDGTIRIRNSQLTRNTNNVGLNDTTVDIIVEGSSYMEVSDSSIIDIPPTGYIVVNETSTFVAINSHIGINFQSSDWSRLQMLGSSRAYLYGITTTEPASYPPQQPAIVIGSANAEVELHKWVDIHVMDAAKIPVGGAFITVQNLTETTPVSAPRSEILNYLGRTTLTWNKTDKEGDVLFPLKTNTLKYGTPVPDNNFTGTYKLTAKLTSFASEAEEGISFESYPRLLDADNTIRLNMTFDEVVPPDLNDHFSTRTPLKILGNTVFNKPIQIQENIIVDGGTLTLDSMNMVLSQTSGHRYYILVKNGGTLDIKNSNLYDINSRYGFFIYNYGSTINAMDTDINTDGSLSVLSGGHVNFDNTDLNGVFYVDHPESNITITGDSYLNGTDIVMDRANLVIHDSIINASEDLSVFDCTLSAINSSFSKHLYFGGSTIGELINVDIVGPADLSVSGSAVISRGWWLTTNVTDAGYNPVPGASFYIYNYTLPTGKLGLYSSASTNGVGQVITKVIGEIIDSSGPYSGIERSYYLNATYNELESNPEGFSSPTFNTQKFLRFSAEPDLTPTELTMTGDKIEGKTITFKAKIANNGNFEARDITVRFLLNNKQISVDKTIGFIDQGESAIVTVDWTGELGNFPVTVTVDPGDDIGESNEYNNNLTAAIDISTGAPDIKVHTVDINFNPSSPTKDELVNISVAINNIGDTDPLHFNNPVYVDIYLGDPLDGGMKLGNTTMMNSILPNSFMYAYAEYTFVDVGNYEIHVDTSTALDSDMTNNYAIGELTVFDFADLTLKTSDIMFLPGDEVAKGTEVTIQAKVVNLGESVASNVRVSFYEGDPDSGESMLLGNRTASFVLPNDSTMVELMYNPVATGPHNIYVVVDSLNDTRELLETNNMANNTLRVLKEPDIMVDPTKVMFYSTEPNHIVRTEQITITAEVENIGETTADSFVVEFFYQSTITLIGAATVDDLIPGNTTTVEIMWMPPEVGTFNLIIWADATQLITEIDEENNLGVTEFRVFSKPDLTMDQEDLKAVDITETPLSVSYSKTVKFTATIRNRGETDSNGFWVQFFDVRAGGTLATGIQIGLNKRIDTGIAAGELTSVEIEWTAIPGGQHTIYFLIDTSNEIDEVSELNNSKSIGIYVETIPDLKVTADDITIEAGSYGRINTPTKVTATIHNTGDTDSGAFDVNFYLGDPIHDAPDDFSALELVALTGLEGGASTDVQIDWTPTSFGVNKIFVWIDEDSEIFELSDENNIAGVNFEVLRIAPDLTFELSGVKIQLAGADVSSYKTNTTYDFNLEIMNEGEENITGFSVSITYTGPGGSTGMLGDGEHILIEDVVPKDDSIVFTTTWKPVLAGTYHFTITLDSMSEFIEFDEDNNANTTSAITVTTLPNLGIADKFADLSIFPSNPAVGDTITIDATITVSGYYENTQITLEFWVNDIMISAHPINLQDKRTSSTTVTIPGISWKADIEGYATFLFKIDPANVEAETNEGDNEVTYTDLYVTPSGAAAGEKESDSNFMMLLIIIIIVVVVVIVLFVVMRRRAKQEPIECQECGEMVPPGETNCPECGTEVVIPPEEVECAKCGALITVEDQNCPECNELNEAYVPPEPGAGVGGLTDEPGKPAAPAAPAPKKSKKKKPQAGAGPPPSPTPQAAPAAAPGMPAPAPGGPEADMPELEGIDGILTEEGEGEAECYKCGARVPLSVPSCPVCGADFE
jgi:subtilase family serine protease